MVHRSYEMKSRTIPLIGNKTKKHKELAGTHPPPRRRIAQVKTQLLMLTFAKR